MAAAGIDALRDALGRALSTDQLASLLHEPFVQRAIVASVLLGVLAGLLAPFVALRRMAFAVHGTSELATTGAAGALLAGASVTTGALVGAIAAALLFGILGERANDEDSIIGVVLAFGLGLGVLFLSLYQGRAANKLGLLVGHIVSVDDRGLVALAVSTLAVTVALAVLYRPLLFASADADLAAARGVPVRLLSTAFAVMLGVAVAFAVQTVGAILVLSVMITPGAAAARIARSPGRMLLASVAFAELALVGGLLLSLSPGLPTSPYVTTISFAIYLACRLLGRRR